MSIRNGIEEITQEELRDLGPHILLVRNASQKFVL